MLAGSVSWQARCRDTEAGVRVVSATPATNMLAEATRHLVDAEPGVGDAHHDVEELVVGHGEFETVQREKDEGEDDAAALVAVVEGMIPYDAPEQGRRLSGEIRSLVGRDVAGSPERRFEQTELSQVVLGLGRVDPPYEGVELEGLVGGEVADAVTGRRTRPTA